MSDLRNERILLVILFIVFAAAFTWLVGVMNANNDLRRSLNLERLRGEALLSEKLFMEKSVIETQQVIKSVMDSLATADARTHEHITQIPCRVCELKQRLTEAMDRLQSAAGSGGHVSRKVE